MRNDVQFVASIERAGTDDCKSRSRAVCVVDPSDTDWAAALPRDTFVSGRTEFVEQRVTAHLELIFSQNELQAEGATLPGLAISAMTRIGVGYLVSVHAIADMTATTASIEHIGHRFRPV